MAGLLQPKGSASRAMKQLRPAKSVKGVSLYSLQQQLAQAGNLGEHTAEF